MKKQTLKGQAALTAASTALVRGMGFVLRLWISRMLGAEALGIMELASGAHMLALTPATAGLPGAVSRLTARAKDEEGRQLALYAGRQMALWMGLAVLPVFLALSPALARWMGDERCLPSLALFAPCVLTVGLSSVYDGACFGRGKALPPALSEISEQLARMAVLLALAAVAARLTPAYRAAMPALASTLGEGVGLAVMAALAGGLPSFRGDGRLPALRREMTRLSLPLLLNRLCHTGLRMLCGVMIPQRLMAGGMERAEAMSQLGMFSGMVMPFMFLPCMLSGALSAVGGPAAARCKSREAESRLVGRLLLCSLGAGAAGGAGLYAAAPLIARYFYRLPELAPLLRLSCPLALILPMQQATAGLMTGLGLQRRSLRASLIGSLALLGCTWLFTPLWGIGGAALASMAGHGLTLALEGIALLRREARRKGGREGSASLQLF